jgi:hypothetical protein
VVSPITPMTSVRVVDTPVLANGSAAEKISPAVTVKLVDVPMALPVLLLNVIVPAHDAGVPPVEFGARLATLI